MVRMYRAKGFGLIELVIGVAILIVLASGYYLLDFGRSGSSFDVGQDALKQAKDLTAVVRDRVDTASGTDGKSLDLSNKSLTSVPKYVFESTEIEELNLSGNKLTGALPAEIRQLRKLRVLNVSDNDMTGIPAEIGQLSGLVALDYSNNQITGLPYEIGNLDNLKTLNLSGNNYSAVDLDIIRKKLPNLEVID